MYIFIMIMQEFISEKVNKLRQGLNIFGIKHRNYFLSWLFTGMILSTFVAVYTILLGYCF